MTEASQQYELQQGQREARLASYKMCLIRLLRRAGAAEALIAYDGEGDNGQIESVTLHNAQGKLLPDAPLSPRSKRHFSDLHLFKPSLEGALEAFAWELLSVHHGGFEDNEGAYGTITIDVAQETATIEHHARVIDVCTSTTEV